MLDSTSVNDFPMNSRQGSRVWDRATLLDYLIVQGIAFEEVLHQPVNTMTESAELGLALAGSRCKNLLVQDKKAKQRFLVVTPPDTSMDLGALGRILGVGRLSLCPPEVMKSQLQVAPGSLSPLALVADPGPERIRLILDTALRDVSHFLFHPLVNTSTVSIHRDCLQRLIRSTGHVAEFVDVPARSSGTSQ